MAHQHDGLSVAFVPAEGVEALLLKAGIADGQDLVHDQQVGLRQDGDAECESHLHARGEVLELLFRKLLELGEGEHLVDLLAQLSPGEAEHRAAEEDVLAGGELRIEADAELEERGELAVHAGVAGVGFVDAAEDLEQRALATSVGTGDAEELPGRDVEGDVPQRDQVAVSRRAAPVRHPVLQRAASVERNAESLAKMRDLDDRAHSDSANFGVSLLKTTKPKYEDGDGEQDRDDDQPAEVVLPSVCRDGSTSTYRRSVTICAMGFMPASTRQLLGSLS